MDAARRALLVKAIAEPAARWALIAANTAGTRSPALIDAILQLSLGSTRSLALAAYLDSWSTTDFSSEVRNVAFPLQLIIGDLDPGAPLSRMQKTILRWHPQAACHRLPGVGHYPPQEEPPALHALIAAHLLRCEQ